MDELVNALVATVTQAGGSIAWEELINSVDYADRQKVPKALKVAKAKKKLKRYLSYDNGVRTHDVILYPVEAPSEEVE